MAALANYFKGLNFFISSNSRENSIPKKRIEILQKLISKHGGILAESSKDCDYIISNRLDSSKSTHSKVVSPDFISHCIEEKSLLPVNSFLITPKNIEKRPPLKSSTEAKDIEEEDKKEDNYVFKKACKLDGPNEDIIEQLEVIKNHRYVTGNPRSELSYARAIAGIRSLSSRIKVESVKTIPFVGPKISSYIADYLETSEMPEVKDILNDENYQALNRFTKIHGVGPKTAKDFYQRGYRQLKDIPAIDLTDIQRIGLRYYDDFAKPLTQTECADIVETVKKHVYPVDSLVEATGGYRRGKQLSNDLDILIRSSNPYSLEKTMSALKKAGYVADVLTQTTHPQKNDLDKCFFVWKGRDRMHRVDILVATPDQYPFAMLGWTGNQQFERSLRLFVDRERNWHLTSVGLYTKGGRKVKGVEDVKEERDIFDLIGIPYLSPQDRNC
jgi:DNA polymerase/3'-5' exonuclease PolX